ncbi:MAG: tetratricopeptide repeat protein, partial [Nitrospinota bacterium]
KEKYQVFTNKGTCYLNLGLYKEASESFGAVYRLGVRERYLLSQYAFSLRKKGDIKQALLVYKELIGLFPDETSAYKNAGIIYDLYMNLPREAIGYYKEYIERGGPDSVNVKNWRQVAMDKTKGWFE